MSPLRPDELPRFAELEAEYEILRELGRGGTAVVYLARERSIGRDVAIKVVRSTYVEDAEAAARLIREARTVAGLDHPNIVLLYGTRRLGDGSLALIMQYVAGRTLREEIATSGRLPVARIRQVLTDLASALEHAHGHGIVHRDIKPENIYVDARTGAARVSDFGIARPLAESSLTLPGSAIGTPAYMSPEQIDGSQLDGRSDLYSLGLIGWELLTGRQPWAGTSLYSMIYKQKHEPLPSPVLDRDDVPPGMVLALEGALRKSPEERLPSARAFIDVLSGRVSRLPPASAPALSAVGPAASPAAAGAVEDGATIVFRRDAAGVPQIATPAAVAVRPPAPAPRSAQSAGPVATADPEEDAHPQVFSLLRKRRLHVGVALLLLGGAASALALTLERRGPGEEGSDVMTAPPVQTSVAAAVPSPEPAAAIAVSGAAQQGIAGDTLPQWLVVRVQDEAGSPLAGVEVVFTSEDTEGVLTQRTVRSDEMGLAGTRWIPSGPGSHVARAVVPGRDDLSAEFRAVVEPRPPARLAAVSPVELGSQGEAPVVVRVEDDRGNPVSGSQVTFSATGGGRVRPASAVTDSAGEARAQWTAGRTGAQGVRAAVAGNPSASVRFSGAAPALAVRTRAGLAAGGTHSCWLAREGAAACWGGNDSGQLGDGSASRGARPVPVDAPEPLAAISAGVSHTCAVSVSGSVFCWGANSSGQLGDGTGASRSTPTRVVATAAMTSVAAGATHTCGIDEAGVVHCWGANQHGQLGNGSRTARNRPGPVTSSQRFRSVTVGWAHSCALTNGGQAYCWGRNSSGELGTGRTAASAQPVPVLGGHRFSVLAAGSAHTCGLRTDGVVMCWGDNQYGQLGREGVSAAAVPAAVSADAPFTTVEAGGVHTCALTRSGAAFCWGRNLYGQLGDGSTSDTALPVAVAGGLRFTALHASGAHTCGATNAGAAYCWGFNLEGQLGDGTRTNQSRPVPINRW